MVADLLRISALHSGHLFLNSSVFYQPGNKVTWWTTYIAFSNHLTPHFLPTCLLHTHSGSVCGRSYLHPPPELLSFLISKLRRKPYKWAILRIRLSRDCTRNGLTFVPPFRSILISKIHPYLTSNSSKSTGTVSDTPITPSTEWTDLGRNRFLRHGRRLQRPTSWTAY